MELIASDSSALLVLSMQQVSIQTHLYPWLSASLQHRRIFSHTTSRGFVPFVAHVSWILRTSWNDCSSLSQTCERAAYPSGTCSGVGKK